MKELPEAQKLLAAYWDRRLPVQVESIAGRLGARLEALDDATACSGALEWVDDEPVIRVRSTESEVRRRFTIAHELGHLALGHGRSFRDAPDSFNSMAVDPKEVEANRFAAALLMPEFAVRELIERDGLADVHELAARFRVSPAAMKFRLQALGWIQQ